MNHGLLNITLKLVKKKRDGIFQRIEQLDYLLSIITHLQQVIIHRVLSLSLKLSFRLKLLQLM